jgi:hypothetical protein
MGAIFGGLDGEPELSNEELGVEVAMLCDAMENGFPNQAKCFMQLAQFHPDDTLEDPHDIHREKIERLLREGKVGWVNDLKGDFVGAGNWAILVLADSGIGTNLTGNGGADAAVRLLQGKAVLKDTAKRQSATAEQIRQEYDTISALDLTNSDGRRLVAKKYEPHTTMVIGRSAARRIVEDYTRTEMARVANSGDYPDLDTRTKAAQIALVDILYTLGASKFLEEFKIFKIAYNRRDWVTAADESSREGNDGRDAIVSGLLLPHAASEPLYIDAKGKTIGIDRLD